MNLSEFAPVLPESIPVIYAYSDESFPDYREETLHDVITQIEPRLFEKTTGLQVSDFDLLCTLGVFNSDVMNDAVYKFKRYEDASLSYGEQLDSDALEGKNGLISLEEYQIYSEAQQRSTYV